MTSEIHGEAEGRMKNAVAHLREQFSTVRTGRASPALVEKLRVDYYGSDVPLQQIAGFSVPEARLLVIQPYDQGSIADIEKAIRSSDLGINPSNDGKILRLAFPQLTEERRRELVKVVKGMAEEAKVALRNSRRTARHDVEEFEREKLISEDERSGAEKELDKLTQQYVQDIDHTLQAKEQELLEV
ncbi:MAG: ribosome recycling factor [Acidimicrobiales bacterium]